MKATQTAQLDASTPRWPEIALLLTDPASITVSGVTTALTRDDPQAEAVRLAARQARGAGRPIRMRVSTPGGVQRVIVTPQGRVVPLDTSPTRTGRPPVTGATPSAPPETPRTSARSPRQRSRRVVDRFPRPVRWAGLALGVLTAAALVVLAVHDNTPPAAAATGAVPAPAPVPPAGRLYTQLGPPGWSQQAGWVLPIAAGTVPATDPATGLTAAITPSDRSSSQTAAQRVGPKDRWLSVLEPDGRTRYAAPLDDPPRFGPVITRVDGSSVALLATTEQIRYWPLTGGPGTDIALPAGAQLSAAGESVLLTLPGDRVGYLHGGALRVVQTLPRTDPAAALDGAAVLTQPDTGTWWTLRADAAPDSTRPAAPAGAGAVQAVLAVTATHVLIAWAPAAPDPKTPTAIIAGYDRATGQLLATTTAPAGAVRRAAGVVSNDTAGLTATGPVLLTDPPHGPAALTVVPGFTAGTAADRVYGTLGGGPAVLDANGIPAPLPDGTLTPTGTGAGFLPVLSQGLLYALRPAPS